MAATIRLDYTELVIIRRALEGAVTGAGTSAITALQKIRNAERAEMLKPGEKK